jgi:hypothetical protein
MSSSIGMNIMTEFKIYFDKYLKSYFLAPGSTNIENDSIVFVKLEKKFVINLNN